ICGIRWERHISCVQLSTNQRPFILSFLDRVNVTVGIKEERLMITGMHTVSDIFCVGCGSIVGWKYVRLISIPYWLNHSVFMTAIVDPILDHFRMLLMKRPRSTKKGKLFWRGDLLPWSRFKLTGPDGSRYWVTHDAHMGGSDADDA
ncbi:hypothetical protein B296_00041924, partial [Ensete ventricosum]